MDAGIEPLAGDPNRQQTRKISGQWMQELSLLQETLRMQETLYHPADAGVSLSDSGRRRHSIKQRMQKSLHQTADAGDTLSDSGCRDISIRQRMHETLYQTADAEVSLSDSGCRRHSFR